MSRHRTPSRKGGDQVTHQSAVIPLFATPNCQPVPIEAIVEGYGNYPFGYSSYRASVHSFDAARRYLSQ